MGDAASRWLNGLFNFDHDAIVVTDADEEVLELYMDLACTSDSEQNQSGDSGGLGFLNSSSSILEIELLLRLPPNTDTSAKDAATSRGGRRAKAGKKRPEKEQEIKVEVKVQQDLSALKGRKGDTGSVLWRSSLHLARHLLTQAGFPPTRPLLNPERLSDAHVLELGAGTGLLALLLHPLCASYTASDRLENLKLVHRNLELNAVKAKADSEGVAQAVGKGSLKAAKRKLKGQDEAKERLVQLEEIDWVEVSQNRHRREAKSPITASSSLPLTASPSASTPDHLHRSTYDLVLAVDCIYNENLVQPLVDTLAEYCPRNSNTVVWVVVELRSSEVLTQFLDKWIHDPSGPWTIVRLGPDAMGDWEGRRPRWVGWVGWR